jgi:hypothetical protein
MASFVQFAARLKSRLPVVAVLTFAISAMDLMRVAPLLADAPLSGVFVGGAAVLGQTFLCCLMAVCAITWIERTPFGAAHPVLGPALAVIAAIPVATALGTWLSTRSMGLGWIAASALSWWGLYLYILWYALIVGLLAAAYFGTWERARQSASDLRRAEIERQDLKQRMVESRLNVMKARVDPEFLFRMIGDVQRLYRTDVDAAEGRLEDFIDYLRAALPRTRGGATTLGEEMHLAQTYVRLHDDAFGGRLQATFDVADELVDSQFPPMALLPLVDDALRRAATSSRALIALRVSAGGGNSGLVVHVDDDCDHVRLAAEGEPALVSHERAFAQFFGEGARVMRMKAGAGTRVTLEIDHAIRARADR